MKSILVSQKMIKKNGKRIDREGAGGLRPNKLTYDRDSNLECVWNKRKEENDDWNYKETSEWIRVPGL